MGRLRFLEGGYRPVQHSMAVPVPAGVMDAAHCDIGVATRNIVSSFRPTGPQLSQRVPRHLKPPRTFVQLRNPDRALSASATPSLRFLRPNEPISRATEDDVEADLPPMS